MSRNILVTGATGRQGGSLIKTLLASPEASSFQIFALSRNQRSPAAMKLKEQGVTTIQGDLNDVPAIFENAELSKQPLWGVFSVQNPGIRTSGAVEEVKQGKSLVDAAVGKDVQLFVYASVDRGGTDSSITPTPVAQFASKHVIEQYLMAKAGQSMKWVILRPVTFMENLYPDIQGKTWASAYKYILKSRPMHLISTSDIGKVAATVFLHPEKYENTSITLVSEKLTFTDLDKIFKEKTGKPIPTMPWLAFQAVILGLNQLKIMFQWFPAEPPGIDAEKCREEWGSMTWEEWVEKESAWKRT
ncbi:nucleoside-diphosphate-sugar epimerase family protein [Venturia nashicola]|uniref:Nucleoside-diphosphate-sugar epimerase family protein n=1 Tax=Venturia nashicola TaxID=86259 RepID=A0A4Z1P0L8_9PEZI|nr:nucleoside-diphosphate-sugar epimerase family protein [Venturia nashicola]